MIELDAQVDVLPSAPPARRRDEGEGLRPHRSMDVAGSPRAFPTPSSTIRMEAAHGLQVWSSSREAVAAGADFAVLDRTELARAERLRFEQDRLRFVHAHAFVRRVLAECLGTSPSSIRYRTTPLGKPFIDGRPDVSFSLSHSGDAVVVAVARGPAVGVDIERLRRVDDALDIARGLFSARERAALATLPPRTRSAAFLALWTRKEAVVKAWGTGLSVALDSFEVLDAGGGWSGPCRAEAAGRTFGVGAFDAPGGYVGSVAVALDHAIAAAADPAVVGRGPAR